MCSAPQMFPNQLRSPPATAMLLHLQDSQAKDTMRGWHFPSKNKWNQIYQISIFTKFKRDRSRIHFSVSRYFFPRFVFDPSDSLPPSTGPWTKALGEELKGLVFRRKSWGFKSWASRKKNIRLGHHNILHINTKVLVTLLCISNMFPTFMLGKHKKLSI